MRILVCTVLLAVVGGAACQTPAPPSQITDQTGAGLVSSPAPAGTPGVSSADSPALQSTAEPTPTQDPAAVAIITSVAIAAAPTATLKPRSSPIPVPSPVAPSKALDPTATDLATKLSALSAALRTQDVSTALRVQRELLQATDQAEAALKNDKSTQAQTVRAAVADIRAAAAGGDSNGFEHAASSLRQVNGGASGALGVTVTSQTRAPEVATDLHTFADQVRGLRQAVQSRNTGEALRLQGQLVAEVAAAQNAAPKDDSDASKALRSALSDLDKGLGGDATRLATAAAAFDKLDGPTDQPGVSATDVPQVAASLASKIDAFRAAASTGSRADLLRLQQEILNDADQAAAALAVDQSPSAAVLKRAVDGVRAGVSGDLTKLDGARADLAKAAGEGSIPTSGMPSTTGSLPKPIADLSRFAADLDNTVNAFQAALQKNDTGTMLRLQRQLSDQAGQVDSSLKDAQSKPADEVRAAVASIRTAFAGDLTKLDEAHVHLRTVAGGTATQDPALNAAARPTTTAVDVQPVANALRDRVTSLAVAVREHQSPDEITKRRDALKAEVTQAEATLNGASDPRATRLRTALTAVREAAGGDGTKAASAQTALDTALGLNGQ